MTPEQQNQVIEAEVELFFRKFYKELVKEQAHPMTAVNVGMNLILVVRKQVESIEEGLIDKVKEQLAAAL